jgi:RNA polymerase sigma factor (sigma-70 family)
MNMRDAVVSAYPELITFAQSLLNRYRITNTNAEDLVQELITQILERNPTVEGGAKGEKLYLIGAVERLVSRHIWKEAYQKELNAEWSDRTIEMKSPTSLWDTEIVERAWACLSERDRELLTARKARKGVALAEKYGVTRQRVDQWMDDATSRFKRHYKRIEGMIKTRENFSQADFPVQEIRGCWML